MAAGVVEVETMNIDGMTGKCSALCKKRRYVPIIAWAYCIKNLKRLFYMAGGLITRCRRQATKKHNGVLNTKLLRMKGV